MKRLLLLLMVFLAVIIPCSSSAEDLGETGEGAIGYAFELQQKEDTVGMRVEFIGNRMFHEGREIGFGIDGKPMLALRHISEYFGCRVDYDSQTRSCVVSYGEYSFRIKPGNNLVTVYYAGEQVEAAEITSDACLRNNVLYLYSLDLSDLLGLDTSWNDRERTWEIFLRDYTYRELGFPDVVAGDVLTVKGLLFTDGRHAMPMLEIMGEPASRSYISSISYHGSGPASLKRYEMSTEILLKERLNPLQVRLNQGYRIIFARNIEVVRELEAKELVVETPYQLASPLTGYVKIIEPRLKVSGSVERLDADYPREVVLFVKEYADRKVLQKVSVPLLNGRFEHELRFAETGLYQVTLNSVMAGPHGPAYPEITDFFVDYVPGAEQ